MIENRSMKRFNLSMPALVTNGHHNHNAECIQMVSRDVSSAGAFLITPVRLELGSSVNISLMLPNLLPINSDEERTVIQLKGTVVRTEPDGIAIAFKNTFKFKPVSAIAHYRIDA